MGFEGAGFGAPGYNIRQFAVVCCVVSIAPVFLCVRAQCPLRHSASSSILDPSLSLPPLRSGQSSGPSFSAQLGTSDETPILFLA